MDAKALSQLRALALAFVVILVTLPLMLVQWLLLRLNLAWSRVLPHLYHRLVCILLGVYIEVEGKLPGPGLLVANHTSWLDIPVLSSLRPLSFIAKKEVAGWPFFGTLARLQSSVFIDRARRLETGVARGTVMRRLEAGERLVLFAEGTSGPGPRLKPLKSALFGTVEHGLIPVYPVAVQYVGQHGLPITRRQRPHLAWYGDMALVPHLWAVLRDGPIGVRVTFLPALVPSAYDNRKALAEATEAQIRAALGKRLHPTAKIS